LSVDAYVNASADDVRRQNWLAVIGAILVFLWLDGLE
jgi:hypothetical protein